MGGHLTKDPQASCDQELLNQIRKQGLDDVIQCRNILAQEYQDCHYVSYKQFDNIFGSLLDDPSECFNLLRGENNSTDTVDIYEALALFFIFCRGNLDVKVPFFFALFDFDNNGSLESPELHMTLQAVARALCKFIHISLPRIRDIEVLAQSAFKLMDTDHNKKISPQEFLDWVSTYNELQEFLLKHTGKLTLEYAQKRLRLIDASFHHYFTQAASDPNSNYASESSVRRVLNEKVSPHVEAHQIDLLMRILKDSTEQPAETSGSGTVISREVFNGVARAWSAFSALDYHNCDKLSQYELKTLLWIYEGQEPSELKLTIEMHGIDADHSGFISREEWIKNFCSSDKDGKMEFKRGLRDLFQKFDADQSGSLTCEEVKAVVFEAFKDDLNNAADAERRKILEGMFESLAKEIFKELNTDNNDIVDWIEFKAYIDVAVNKIQKLRKFLDDNSK